MPVDVRRDIHRHIHRRKPADSLGPVNVVNVVNVFRPRPSRGRTHPRTRKHGKNIHDIHERRESLDRSVVYAREW